MSRDRDDKQSFASEVPSQHRVQATKSAAKRIRILLEIENELRIKVGENSDIKIELFSGVAEIYGSEMVLNKDYSLPPNVSIAIYTWDGCKIMVSGEPEEFYTVRQTLMIVNVIFHVSLQIRRVLADALNQKGPVLLVVGPNDVTRNALCRFLLNYAARMRRSPLFIDLDVGQNSISLPSSIGILTVEKPSDVVSGFDDHAMEVYQYGYRSPRQNIRLYSLLVQRLGETLQSRLRQANENVRTSGIVINGCDWSRDEILHHGYNVITHVAMHFKIDILCVLEEESLYVELKRNMPSNVKVNFIPQDQCTRNRSQLEKSQDREICIHKYFYGSNNQLKPFKFEVNYSDVKVFKIGASSIKRDIHALDDIRQSDVELKPVLLDANLVDQILGMSSADDVHEDIMYMPVVYFICITNVDIVRNTITVLSPQPNPLPKKIFLMGDTKINKCQ